jgi:hypothetical protein
LETELSPISVMVVGTNQKIYANAMAKAAKMWPMFLDLVCNIGQLQLLRKSIAMTLRFSSKLDSNALSGCLEALNLSLMKDVQEHYKK